METICRRSISVHGLVQGVGFRPHVHRLAQRLGLAGFVCNQTAGVLIEAEGAAHQLDRFIGEIEGLAPPSSQVAQLQWHSATPRGEQGFRIEASRASAGVPFVAADRATCAECLREIFDPADRRHGHAFASCTQCGPRFTLVTGMPFDRERTTMAGFAMCARCAAEYEDAQCRRFHAQPIACPDCGPRLAILDAGGVAVDTPDPIAWAATALRAGRILAIKGLGGYHLACAAGSALAVAELRRRKARDHKPFAVMVADVDAAAAIADLDANERELLAGAERPIVLLRTRRDAALAAGIAPGLRQVGVMLAYTPLHHLLLRATAAPLVMTSGNRSDEPMVHEDGAAVARLGAIADFFLSHDRAIRSRCDDSVARVIAGAPALLRRARGHAPAPLDLPQPLAAPTLALGGQQKAVFAFGQDRQALASPHCGDLDQADALQAFEDAIAHFRGLFGMQPRRLVHDLHPDYASTRWAQQRARSAGLALIGVQHHHAHIASCMAEHGLRGAVIGVAFDGSGWGTDGTVWGGEFLIADYRAFHRAALLRSVALPGGEAAVRAPWRMALAHALAAGADPSALPLPAEVTAREVLTVTRMIERGLNAPQTSSIGRLFDAVAAIAGLAPRTTYEAQAAMQLEDLATNAPGDEAYEFALDDADDAGALQLDPRPVIVAALADAAAGVDAGRIGRRFHLGLAQAVASVCERLRAAHRLDRVALSGGVFANALLAAEVQGRLQARGFTVYRQQRMPTNDGGLCLGQLAIAAGRDAAREG